MMGFFAGIFLFLGLVALASVRGILPMAFIRQALATLLASDTATLANGAGNHIRLIKAPFALSENTLYADLSFADFTGAGSGINIVVGAQEVGQDVNTGDWVITLNPPVGGFRWITGDLLHLPQTIYGYAVTDSAGTTLIGLAAFDTPITLVAANQEINIGPARFTFVQQPLS